MELATIELKLVERGIEKYLKYYFIKPDLISIEVLSYKDN